MKSNSTDITMTQIDELEAVYRAAHATECAAWRAYHTLPYSDDRTEAKALESAACAAHKATERTGEAWLEALAAYQTIHGGEYA